MDGDKAEDSLRSWGRRNQSNYNDYWGIGENGREGKGRDCRLEVCEK